VAQAAGTPGQGAAGGCGSSRLCRALAGQDAGDDEQVVADQLAEADVRGDLGLVTPSSSAAAMPGPRRAP
jgi:hypothetical protein